MKFESRHEDKRHLSDFKTLEKRKRWGANVGKTLRSICLMFRQFAKNKRTHGSEFETHDWWKSFLASFYQKRFYMKHQGDIENRFSSVINSSHGDLSIQNNKDSFL